MCECTYQKIRTNAGFDMKLVESAFYKLQSISLPHSTLAGRRIFSIVLKHTTRATTFRKLLLSSLRDESSSFRNVVARAVCFKTIEKVFLVDSDVLQIAPFSRNSVV